MATMRSAPSLLLNLLQRSTAFQVKFFVVLGRVPASSGWKILAHSKSVGCYFKQFVHLGCRYPYVNYLWYQSSLTDWHMTFQNFLSNLNFSWFVLSAMVDIMVMAGGKVSAASSAFSNYYSSLCITSITGTFEAFLRSWWLAGLVPCHRILSLLNHILDRPTFHRVPCFPAFFRVRFSNYDSTLQSPANSESKDMSIAVSLRN